MLRWANIHRPVLQKSNVRSMLMLSLTAMASIRNSFLRIKSWLPYSTRKFYNGCYDASTVFGQGYTGLFVSSVLFVFCTFVGRFKHTTYYTPVHSFFLTFSHKDIRANSPPSWYSFHQMFKFYYLH
jgi:hypothetical protein